MNQKEIKELIEFLIDKDIAEFELERGDVKLRVRRGNASSSTAALAPAAATILVPTPQSAAAPTAPPASLTAAAATGAAPASTAAPATASAAAVAAEPATEEALEVVRSPIVGTFYEAPSPGAPPFVKVGDQVSVGQVLCIVEAMKLMNEIESDFAGVIVKKFVENAQPVEYGQPLFAIRP